MVGLSFTHGIAHWHIIRYLGSQRDPQKRLPTVGVWLLKLKADHIFFAQWMLVRTLSLLDLCVCGGCFAWQVVMNQAMLGSELWEGQGRVQSIATFTFSTNCIDWVHCFWDWISWDWVHCFWDWVSWDWAHSHLCQLSQTWVLCTAIARWSRCVSGVPQVHLEDVAYFVGEKAWCQLNFILNVMPEKSSQKHRIVIYIIFDISKVFNMMWL